MHPSSCVCFQVPQHIGKSKIRPKLRQQVNMIFRTIEFQRNASDGANGSADVIIKPHLIARRNKWATILCGKDDVIKKVCVELGHFLLFGLSPASRAGHYLLYGSWGSRPRLY